MPAPAPAALVAAPLAEAGETVVGLLVSASATGENATAKLAAATTAAATAALSQDAQERIIMKGPCCQPSRKMKMIVKGGRAPSSLPGCFRRTEPEGGSLGVNVAALEPWKEGSETS